MSKIVGEVRKSQLITTYGVGSMVDLPSLSAMVLGLDYWDRARCIEVEEPRLLRAVKSVLGPQVKEIRQSPDQPDTGNTPYPSDPGGVPTALFPRWLRCPLCSTLAPVVDGGVFRLQSEPYRQDRIRYIHASCTNKGTRSDSKMPAAVPARFIVACENGHMDDFPWDWFVHRGNPCGNPKLRLFESGVSGEAADVYVACESCSNSAKKTARPLSDAFGKDNDIELVPCSGTHPHLNGVAATCNATRKTLLIGASNSYFGITLSALSIPKQKDELTEKVSRNWSTFGKVDGLAEIAMLRKFNQLGELDGNSDAAIWQAIQTVTAGDPDSDSFEDIKRPEWDLFSAGTNTLGQDLIKLVEVPVPARYTKFFERVVLVEKHVEVRALVGFTRIESAGDMSELDALPQERRVPLSRRRTSWVPGALVRGEGIFIQFREEEVARWEEVPEVRAREARLRQAHENWLAERKWMQKIVPFPGARYILLHSLSHALIRELGIRCGYGTASIRERLYCAPTSDINGPMCGMFLGTASSDSEGTLGGLVSLGKPAELASILDIALERLRICASDPLCATYDPQPRSKLHGAACHSCGFLPETSCERANRYLDRSLLVETMAPSGAAFFGGIP